MKSIWFAIFFILICLSLPSFSQIKFPKEFKLVKGDSGSGRDDIYTNGRYNFDTHQLFVENEYKTNDNGVKNYLSDWFKFPFHITRDSLYWGTGYTQGFYSYVVITADGSNIELYSEHNDSGFSKYSEWLLATLRAYKKKGKSAYFPLRFK